MKQTSYRFLTVVTLIIATTSLTGGGCPSGTESSLDAARAALDVCNPSDNSTVSQEACQDAVTKAEEILTSDPDNVDAAIAASSGYLGLAGIDFLQFVEELVGAQSDTANSDLSEFSTLVSSVEKDLGREIDLTDLGLAQTRLSAVLTGVTVDTEVEERASFQLGAIQAIDIFVRPIKLISRSLDIENLDPDDIGANDISDDDAESLRASFLGSDDNFSASGTTDADTLNAVREGFCRCEGFPALGGYGGPCLRDLTRCELGDTQPTATELDYDGDGATAGDGTADCAALRAAPDVDTCKAENTSE